MSLNYLSYTLSNILFFLLTPLIRGCGLMSNTDLHGIKWGFASRVVIPDEEAAMETTPLLRPKSSSHDEETGGSYPPTLYGNHDDAPVAVTPTLPRSVSPVVAESPNIHSPSLPAVIPHSGSMRSVLQSFKLSKLYLKRFLHPTEESHHSDIPDNDHSARMASQVQFTDQTLIRQILSPVLDDLEKLKASTTESLSVDNPSLDSEAHAQVLKQKLLPIGQFIVHYLDSVEQVHRGALELALCHHIADKYWPLPVNFFTHLRIQEKYRNALYRLEQQTSAKQSANGVIQEDTTPEDELPGDATPSVASPAVLESSPKKVSEQQPNAAFIEPDPVHSSLDNLPDTLAPSSNTAAEHPRASVIMPGSSRSAVRKNPGEDTLDTYSYVLDAEAIAEADARDLNGD
jgi:hypothetical protein